MLRCKKSQGVLAIFGLFVTIGDTNCAPAEALRVDPHLLEGAGALAAHGSPGGCDMPPVGVTPKAARANVTLPPPYASIAPRPPVR